MIESIHICWSKMDDSTICVRLDNHQEGAAYRVSLEGFSWANPAEDSLFYFFGVTAGKRYKIFCERLDGTDWVEACPPVTLNFIPEVKGNKAETFARREPKGGGEKGRWAEFCLPEVSLVRAEP